ncbi:mediator of RNA polymerase II transcription subunit 25 isoform X2 [Benincasa hispida]|uniref:mediator of RNA polymerase II transcription subunit 25 isoform X2 n=1 Tax=Benincasa hispida TaxID=102211 RepID=UPI0019008183|nr:mediator of RNA polymerase II transcription subunit 25 isoform X2 [Benincasa hispida]
MAEKQLIVVVEGTAAMGPFWQTIVSDYIEKIVRSFCGNELTGQKPPTSNVEFSLVTFHTHGSYCGCLVQRTGWTRDVDIFTQWLSAIPFSGGGFSDGAIAEGLAEALMPNGGQNQQTMDMQKHCILVAASNPYPLPTPVYRPAVQNLEQHDNGEPGSSQSYAETVAKSFSQCFISLSVICPKQLPKLRAIYTAGKRNPRAADPPIDNVKTPSYLVLISENFVEARAALSRPGITSLPANQSPVKMDISPVVPVTGPPTTTTPSVNGPIINRQPVSVANVPPATVKVEPNTVTSMTNGSGYPPHMPSVVRAASQGVPSMQTSSPLSSQEMITNNENTQDLKPLVNGVPQPVRPVGPANVSILNNISQARVMSTAALNGGTSIGLPSMGQTPMAMHVSNMISSGMGSSVPAAQNVFSSGQSGMTSINGSSTLTQVAPNSGISSLTSGNNNISGNSNIVTSQAVGNLQGGVSVSQSVPGISQGNLAGTQVVQSGIGVSQNVMSNLTQPGVSSGNGTMIPTPGMPQQVQNGMHSIGVNNAAANMPLPQHSAGALQQAQSKYVKFWEGNLSGQRQGQPVFITRMEGYRSASASDKLAANWPQTMQIVRLISQDHMNNKQYIGKADFLVFRAMNQHGFLGQLQEKKLCAVIQLPSQTLLLSVSDKACRLIGMLFPGDMVVFKPQIPSQQQQQHQMQQQMQQQLQQHPQLQQHQLSQLQHQLPQMQQQQPQLSQLQQQQQQQQQQPLPQLQQQQQQQQLPQIQQQQQQQPQLSQLQSQQMQQQQQQQQMVTGGIGQSYVQGGRSQLVSQGQVSSQGQSNMPGGSFMG